MPEPGRQLRLEDMTAVKKMFCAFQQMDIFQGSGPCQLALPVYMNEHVYSLLHQSHTEEARRPLCQAGAKQTYLLGWMAYDNCEIR